MNQIDVDILRSLQRDSNRPVAKLAEDVGLSTSACHRRVKLLEDAGIIKGYVARLDPAALGLELEVIVEITLNAQSDATLDAFETAVGRYDEILECLLITGGSDYVLRVAAKSVADYDRIHRQCLAKLPNVSNMRTRFALRAVKPWRGYPVRP